jgi:hypothetical protein
MKRIGYGIQLPTGGGVVTFEIGEEDGRMICGIYFIEGRLREPPKRWLRIVRAEMRRIEEIAAGAGCHEMRVAGRDWSRVLPDYEPMPGIKNRLRKRLT